MTPDVLCPVLFSPDVHLDPAPGQTAHPEQPDVRELIVWPPTASQHQQVVLIQVDLRLAVPRRRLLIPLNLHLEP